MKRLVTAAVAATLMCGVSAFAYAQDTSQSTPPGAGASSGSMGSDQSTEGGMNPAPPSDSSGATGSMGSGAATANQPAPDASTAPPPAAGGQDQSGSMSGGAMAGGAAGNTPEGQPPANYPPCTHKGQDRCVQSGHMSEGSSHKMTRSHHHMAKSMSKSTAPASAPAATATPQ